MDNYYLLSIAMWEVVYKSNIFDISIWQKNGAYTPNSKKLSCKL